MEYFIETGRSASDVELMAARLSEKLRILGIRIEEKPAYEKRYQIDEAGFEAALSAEIHYNNPRARIRDVDSISAIARIRRGRESYYPETSIALFITNNSSLARVTRKFFQNDAPAGVCAICMTDYALGNLLWLKNPTKAPELPLKQLLAHAYAALQPPDHLWIKYLTETAKLQDQGSISPDEYYILRHSFAAKNALMDLTQGEESGFSEGTVQEVLLIAKEKLRADLVEEVGRERENRRIAESQFQEISENRALQISNLRQRATKYAKNLKNAALVIGILLIFVGICFTFPWAFPQPRKFLLKYLLTFILVLLFLLTIANLTWGVTLATLLERMEKRISNRIFIKLRRFAGLD